MPDPKTPSLTRRQFATTALLTATAATLGAATSASAVNSADAAQSPAPPLPEASQTESAQRLQTILALYGSRFSDDQKTDLKKICNNTQTSLDRLRAYPTDNADDPALYLKPLWEREKKAAAIPTDKHQSPATPKS
jgi:hypothetical protein